MASLFRTGAPPALGQRARGSRQHAPPRRPSLHRVAAIDPPATFSPGSSSEQHPEAPPGGEPELEQQLVVQELDEAQEGLLKWMLFLDGDQQEADLEAGEGPDEVEDAEYADMFDEVEAMLEETEATFKVGEKVYGTVYEVDDDGAYVEIGAKSAGFVPLSECSLGKLKTVSGRWDGRGGAWGALGSPRRRHCSPWPPPTQPLEVLRPGMKREFVVAEEEDEYGETILSMAAIEVRDARACVRACACWVSRRSGGLLSFCCCVIGVRVRACVCSRVRVRSRACALARMLCARMCVWCICGHLSSGDAAADEAQHVGSPPPR